MQAPTNLAHHLLDAAFKLLREPKLIWPIIWAVVGLLTPWFRKQKKKAKARTVRDWLSVTASIDVVSVVERVTDKKHYFVATLTYFYRRTQLQMGEYEREFSSKAAAQDWAKQLKGRMVMVHVNPQNPADSVLLDSDLAGLETNLAPSAQATTSLDLPPFLEQRYHFLSALGEVLSIAGLAMSGVLLAASIASGGKMSHPWLLWTGGAMLVIDFLLMITVQTHLFGNESAKAFLRTYKHWTPAWMRWTLQLSGAAFGVFEFIVHLHIDLPPFVQQWMQGQTPHVPYILGCLGFLFCASFHTAILRSQEQIQVPVNVA